MSDTKERDLQEIGRLAYESIVDMVNALECDFDRLAELRDEREVVAESEDFEPSHKAALLAAWDEENGEELAALVAAAGEAESREDAEQRIQEDPLSVEVRSGWVSAGSSMDAFKAEEFNILLCTGGPAVRIMGELDQYGQPDRAWLEVQDWGTPWTQYFQADQATLLTYAQQFYFGEG